jgi:hypothetical protein
VLVTCLSNVATQVGVGRIMAGSKFHYPVGNPELTSEEELAWRTELMNKALRVLQSPAAAPTVF